MTEPGGYAPAGGTSLYYEVRGSGPPVVLLHGFSFDTRMWDDQVASLAERYTVVRYDLRGFGRSAPGSESYTHADDLQALLEHLRLERVALVGLSLGGGAAINFSILHPDAVRALIVVDPTLGGFAWSSEFTGAQGAIRAAAREAGIDAARARWLELPTFAPALANPELARRLRALVADYSGWHWREADPGRPFNPPAIQRLGEIRSPTLVIVGELDTPDFQGIAWTLERGIPGAKRLTLRGVGHMANMEAPERFNEVVLGFLGGRDRV